MVAREERPMASAPEAPAPQAAVLAAEPTWEELPISHAGASTAEPTREEQAAKDVSASRVAGAAQSRATSPPRAEEQALQVQRDASATSLGAAAVKEQALCS